MSYFGSEKKINLSISAISSTNLQTISTTVTDVTVFNGGSLTQLASSIGYPSISISSNIVTLEAGWRYCIEVKMKSSLTSASTALNYLIYYITDTSNNITSSTGTVLIYRDNNASFSQEKCIQFFDATSEQKQFKVRAVRGGSINCSINGSTDTQTSDMRSHILIKAWQ
jgi:hypothetical protein